MAFLLRNYDKRQQQFATKKQAEAQTRLINDYTEARYNLQKELGTATGNPEKIAELQQKAKELDDKYKEDMRATADLGQYIDNEAAGTLKDAPKDSVGHLQEENPIGHLQEQTTSDNDYSEVANKIKSGIDGIKAGVDNVHDNITDDKSDNKITITPRGDKLINTRYLNSLFKSDVPNEVNLRRQAEMHDKQAGDEQKNAQQNFAVANRDYRGEAEKNAVSQAASENAQKVANMEGASAGAAALARGVKSADYATHMQRQDQQRAEGVKNQREMWGSRQTAEEERANANKERHDYMDAQGYNLVSNSLSKGNMFFNDKNATGTTKQEAAPEQEVKEPVQEEQPAVEEETQNADEFVNAGNLHVLLNYIEGSTKDADKYNTPEIQALIKKYNVQQLPEANYKYGRQADKVVAERYPEFIADYNRLTSRNVGTNQQIDAKSQADVNKYRKAAELNESQQNIANTLEQNSKYN